MLLGCWYSSLAPRMPNLRGRPSGSGARAWAECDLPHQRVSHYEEGGDAHRGSLVAHVVSSRDALRGPRHPAAMTPSIRRPMTSFTCARALCVCALLALPAS